MPSPVTMLITPGGRPASSNRRIVKCAANCWVCAGFHTTVLPISAGADGQVAGDRREVERRDRVDEAFERPVVEAVPHARRGDRLLGQQLAGEVDVEAQEVDQLAGGVDLRLVAGLGLAEHGGAVERVAPRAGEQVGGLQEDRGAVLEGHFTPKWGGLLGGRHRRHRIGVGRIVGDSQHMSVLVRLDDVDRLTAGHTLLPIDGHRQTRAARPRARRAVRCSVARSGVPGA